MRRTASTADRDATGTRRRTGLERPVAWAPDDTHEAEVALSRPRETVEVALGHRIAIARVDPEVESSQVLSEPRLGTESEELFPNVHGPPTCDRAASRSRSTQPRRHAGDQWPRSRTCGPCVSQGARSPSRPNHELDEFLVPVAHQPARGSDRLQGCGDRRQEHWNASIVLARALRRGDAQPAPSTGLATAIAALAAGMPV
jgi:hypothetical protein